MGFSIYENTYDVYSKGEITLADLHLVVTLQKKLGDIVTTPWKCINLWPYRVKDYRATGNTRIKEKELPAVIPFALTSSEDRKIILRPSGLFCVDIDYGDNKLLFDECGIEAIKKLVAEKFNSTALAFVSPSGRGLKILHTIQLKGKGASDHVHVSHGVFDYYQKKYKKIGLVIDLKCKDWNRLCYLSYDREAYYNESAVPDTIAIPEVVVQPPPVIEDGENGYQLSGDRRDKDQICPKCSGGQHRDKSFTYYVDQYGTRLEGCGVCSRAKCNANIKPREVYPNVKWKYLGKIRS